MEAFKKGFNMQKITTEQLITMLDNEEPIDVGLPAERLQELMDEIKRLKKELVK